MVLELAELGPQTETETEIQVSHFTWVLPAATTSAHPMSTMSAHPTSKMSVHPMSTMSPPIHRGYFDSDYVPHEIERQERESAIA